MMLNTVISGPIPPYSNPPIEPQYFQPSQFVITGLSFGQTTIVTMANGKNGVQPNYVIGQLVRLLIPSKYGSVQINEQTGYVISIPTTNSVVVGINSIGTSPFISSPTFLPFQSKTPPQIVAVGNILNGIISSTGRSVPTTNVPGAFINISPL